MKKGMKLLRNILLVLLLALGAVAATVAILHATGGDDATIGRTPRGAVQGEALRASAVHEVASDQLRWLADEWDEQEMMSS